MTRDNQRSWLFVISVYLLFRIIFCLLAAWVASQELPISPWVNHSIFKTGAITAPDWGEASKTLNVWYRWDTGWYLKIAAFGYNADDGSIIFPPLYPWLIRIGAPLVGDNYLLSALILSNIFCLFSLGLFYRLAMIELGNPRQAQRVVLFFLAFPTAFYLFAGYSESLFLTFTFGAILSASHKRWVLAGMLGFFATLTRLQGWLLTFPLGWMVLVEISDSQVGMVAEFRKMISLFKDAAGRHSVLTRIKAGGWAAIILPLVVTPGYMTWLKIQGLGNITDAFERYWDVKVVSPWVELSIIGRNIFSKHLLATDWIELGLLILVVFLGIIGLSRLRFGFSLYLWGTLGFMLMRSASGHLLVSYMRYFLTLFPIFLILGRSTLKQMIHNFLLAGSLLLEIFLLIVFLRWGWVA